MTAAIVTSGQNSSFSSYVFSIGVDCGDPPSILNAHPASASKTTYGSKVTYNCVHGYFIASGNQSAVCNANGWWDGADLVCKGKSNLPMY